MKLAERRLIEQLGVTPGRPDSLYLTTLALARRCLDLEQRVAALEQRSLGARVRRVLTGRAA